MPRVGSAAEAARAAVSCGLLDPLSLVRESAAFVAAQASHVSVDADAVASVAQHWVESGLLRGRPPFDRGLHYVDESEPAATLQYLFVLDALNWCFWPDGDACGAAEPFEYEHLAGGARRRRRRCARARPRCADAPRADRRANVHQG